MKPYNILMKYIIGLLSTFEERGQQGAVLQIYTVLGSARRRTGCVLRGDELFERWFGAVGGDTLDGHRFCPQDERLGMGEKGGRDYNACDDTALWN